MDEINTKAQPEHIRFLFVCELLIVIVYNTPPSPSTLSKGSPLLLAATVPAFHYQAFDRVFSQRTRLHEGCRQTVREYRASNTTTTPR